MNKYTNTKKNIFILLSMLFLLAGLVGLSTASYLNFSKFSVKGNGQNQEVKGAKDSWSFDFPVPSDSTKIASNRTSDIQQVTIQSNNEPENIHNFYKNIFTEQNFELDSESEEDGFIIKTYVSDDKEATVMTSKQTNETYTIASVELLRKL